MFDNPNAFFWLLVVLGVLLILETGIFAIMIVVRNRNKRRLIGISLDTEIVRRKYLVGEKFDPSGLIVTAHFSGRPYEQTLKEFTIVTPELIEQLAREGKKPEDLEGCLIYAPNLFVEGKPTVTVAYGDQIAAYAISVTEPPVERMLIGLKLNTDMVRKTFTVGEKFQTEGLIVAGLYNTDPYVQKVNDFLVIPPDTSVIGKPYVTVNYLDQSVDYIVNVVEAEPEVEPVPVPVYVQVPVPAPAVVEPAPAVVEVKPAPAPVVEESFVGGTLRYDKSFTARLIQSGNEVKEWYTELKNELLSYKKVHDRMSWKRESYNCGRQSFAKLAYRGETLCLYLPLDPESLADTKYKVESVADSTSYSDTPSLYRIKNNKRAKYAKELIAMVAELMGIPKTERESQDYYLPYEGIVELINKGLVKRNVKNTDDFAAFVEKMQAAEAAVTEDESAKISNDKR